jgi:hypothetical protein
LDGLVVWPEKLSGAKGELPMPLKTCTNVNEECQMSQVEFTAVMATLFRNARAEPVCRKGETKEQARKRLFGVINDSTPVMTLQMNKPRNVKLKWTRR